LAAGSVRVRHLQDLVSRVFADLFWVIGCDVCLDVLDELIV
jgi:hypothetical protein